MPHEHAAQELLGRHLRAIDPLGSSHYRSPVETLGDGYDPAVQPLVEHHPVCRACPHEAVCLMDLRQRCEVRVERVNRRIPVGVPGEKFRHEVVAHLTFYPLVVDTGQQLSGEASTWTYQEMATELEKHMAQRARGEFAWLSP